MDWVHLPSGVLHEKEYHVPDVVEDMTEVVHSIHYVVLGIVSVLHCYYVIEVGINILACTPAMECYWMQLLSDFRDKKSSVKKIVDVLKEVLCAENHSCHIHDLIGVQDQVIFYQELTDMSLITFEELSTVQEARSELKWTF